jgi:hypothetical protein
MKHQVYNELNSFGATILQGLKGHTFLEVGYVFAPCVPLQITPLLRNIKLAGLKLNQKRA